MIEFKTIRQYNFPTVVRFGPGAVSELPDHLTAAGLKNVFIVTDPVVRDLLFFNSITSALQQKAISVEVFSDIHKNPVKSDVLRGGDLFKAGVAV